ncbi:unnamed protein product [Brassica napus]|uniref:(rape) hypothetical protein n=1 Tax=Brassica napus TaxID=3708 RepID=A0A816IMX6_BRANA|nr:unnamed protein product [Brassica napus]
MKVLFVSSTQHLRQISVFCVQPLVSSFSQALRSFLRDLRNEAKELNCNSEEPFQLYDQVLRCNPGAFEYAIPGFSIASQAVFNWPPEETRFFFQLYAEERKKGNRTSTSMNKIGKQNIIEAFEAKFKKGYDTWPPFKNKYDTTSAKRTALNQFSASASSVCVNVLRLRNEQQAASESESESASEKRTIPKRADADADSDSESCVDETNSTKVLTDQFENKL